MNALSVARRALGTGLLAGLALGLISCDGGSPDSPSVSNISAIDVRYGDTAAITVSGRKLLNGIRVEVDGICENIARRGTGSNDTQIFDCNVNGLGEFRAYVIDGNGDYIGQITLKVETPQVNIVTTMGTFVLELDPVAAPVTVKNFLAYANDPFGGFYRDTIFHRVIKDLLIQAGGYAKGMVVKVPNRAPIVLESNNGLKNLRGTIGAARTSEPDSAQAQWYINVKDTPGFDYVDPANPGYAVFGKVISGMEVVDAISIVETHTHPATGLPDVPVAEVTILGTVQTR